MTINYGKRAPGGLTAASPGDTLYIPLQFFNDSGASIGIGSTLAVTDIELFRNGDTGFRETDSGYSVLGDTGNFDDRIGFKGISIQLFNNSSDTGFYDIGSHYWVAIDSVTVDGRTVRFFPAVFEIDTPKADTGAIATAVWSNHATRALTAFPHDTGVADTVWKNSSRVLTGFPHDTGIWDSATRVLTSFPHDTGVWGSATRTLTAFSHDTGVADTTWKYSSRVLTGFPHDTGIWDSATRTLTANTNLNDPTVAQIVDGVWDEADTGHGDTGTYGRLSARTAKIAADTDTGLQASVTVTSIAADTITATSIQDDAITAAKIAADAIGASELATDAAQEIAGAVWDEADTGHSDTGTYGRLRQGVRVMAVFDDTGAAAHLAQMSDEYDTGRLPAEATATLDTGGVNQAVWQGDATRVLTANTNLNIAEAVWDEADTGHQDTGTYGRLRQGVNVTHVVDDTGAAKHLAQLADEYDTGRLPAEATATTDTGAVNQAVWQADASRVLTGFPHDTGVSDTVWKETSRVLTGFPHDTGIWDSATRVLTSFPHDTGVWGSATRTLTANTNLNDPTVAQIVDGVWDEADTGHGDSGSFGRLSARTAKIGADTDTGLQASVTVTSIAADTITATSIQDSAITAAKIATDAITAAKIAADAIGASELGADAVREIAGGVWDEADTGHGDTGTYGRLSARMAKVAADTDTGIQGGVNVTSIADTGLNSRLDVILADTDTGIQGGVNVSSFADTGVNDRLAKILADTDTGLQASVTVTAIAADVITSTAIATDAIGAAELASDAVLEIAGAVWDEADTGHGDTGTYGRLSARTAKIAADTDTGIAPLTATEVNAEVVDALATDTYAEPGTGVPGATVALSDKIGYLYKAWRNRTTQDTGSYDLYNDDASTVGQRANVTDDGSTFDKGEVGSG